MSRSRKQGQTAAREGLRGPRRGQQPRGRVPGPPGPSAARLRMPLLSRPPLSSASDCSLRRSRWPARHRHRPLPPPRRPRLRVLRRVPQSCAASRWLGMMPARPGCRSPSWVRATPRRPRHLRRPRRRRAALCTRSCLLRCLRTWPRPLRRTAHPRASTKAPITAVPVPAASRGSRQTWLSAWRGTRKKTPIS